MSEPPKFQETTDYEVGYRKPPKSTRFRKGQSGNPKGRPKGSKSKGPKSLKMMRDLVIKEAYREVTIQDKNGSVSMPVVQAALRSLALKAAQGNVAAHKQLLEVLSRAEADEFKERLETFDKVVAYKKEKLAELRAFRARDEEPPLMLPHPDDIEIDYETAEVVFHGPVNEDDYQHWLRLHGTIEQLGEEIRHYREKLASMDAGNENVGWIQEEIESNRYIIMTACLSIARRWRLPAREVMNTNVSYDELVRHLSNGTDPAPPKNLQKIVEARKA